MRWCAKFQYMHNAHNVSVEIDYKQYSVHLGPELKHFDAYAHTTTRSIPTYKAVFFNIEKLRFYPFILQYHLLTCYTFSHFVLTCIIILRTIALSKYFLHASNLHAYKSVSYRFQHYSWKKQKKIKGDANDSVGLKPL